MVLTMLPMAAMAASFDDVADDHWAAGSIDRWAGYGVLGGHGDGTFTPDKSMTRAEFASMLVKMLGLTAKSDKTFGDVDADAWYADVVSKAVAAGIINGKSADAFAPNDPVSFEEAAVMMCRAFGLAKTTSGDDWSKESIEKLTSLGMIGEGADEHLQVGVDCSRAVVAALADAVVAEYVNEDRAEPITGEVKGVVLVVNQAKVELKDATVAAPIVVESASVTLTNTQADNVKVSGSEAAVAADKESSVADVIVAGTAPAVAIEGQVKGDVSISGEAAKVELNGEVAGSVTVEEAATGAEIKGEGVTADKVTNNSAEDVKVNDETVEAKPDDTQKPDDAQKPTTPSTGDDTGDTGDVGGGSGNTGGNTGTGGDKPTKPTDPELPEAKPSDPTKDPVPDPDEAEVTPGDKVGDDGEKIEACETHTWENKGAATAGTCKAFGSQPQECSVCGATRSIQTAKGAHTEGSAEVTTAATCVTKGVKVTKCSVCQEVLKSEYVDVDASNHKSAAVADDSKNKDATCTEKGWSGATKCPDCGAAVAAGEETPAAGHKYGDWETVTPATCTTAGSRKHVCSVCNNEETGTIEATGHNYGEDGVCTVCGANENGGSEGTGGSGDGSGTGGTGGTGGTVEGGGDTGTGGTGGNQGGTDGGTSTGSETSQT